MRTRFGGRHGGRFDSTTTLQLGSAGAFQRDRAIQGRSWTDGNPAVPKDKNKDAAANVGLGRWYFSPRESRVARAGTRTEMQAQCLIGGLAAGVC